MLLFHQHDIRSGECQISFWGGHSGKAYVSSALFFKELPDSSETGIRESKIGTECSINGRD